MVNVGIGEKHVPMICEKHRQHDVMPFRYEEIKPPFVSIELSHGEIAARFCVVSAFWNQTRFSNQNIVEVLPELTHTWLICSKWYFLLAASLLR